MLFGSLEALAWESKFFGISSAILHMRDDAPPLCEDDLREWQRIQVKIPADRTDWLDILQKNNFQLVEGEVSFTIMINHHTGIGGEIATKADIIELRLLATKFFMKTRFRPPWYSMKDSRRFYAQWIENAIKGMFDHQCLVFRAPEEGIRAFVSLRQLNEHEGRIGLLAGYGIGKELVQTALHWAQQRRLSVLRIVTQMGNIAAIRSYIASGANIDTTDYWLYR